MQENLFCTIKPFLSLFKINTTLLIGSGTGSYLPLLSSLGLQDVLLVEADKNQIEKMYKMHDFSKKYQIENSLIITDADIFPFYVATYKKLSGTQKLKKYKTIMPNISLLETQEIKAESLDSFTQRMDTHIEFLIIDTFTAKDILKEGIKTLENIKIILCASLLEDKDELIEEIEKKGFKKIEIFMDNNPEFVMVLFVRDYIKKFDAQVVLANSLEEELDKYKKELDLELVKKNKILEELAKEKEQNEKLIARRDFLVNDVLELKEELDKNKKELDLELATKNKILEELAKEKEQSEKLIARRDFLVNDLKLVTEKLEKSNSELNIKEKLLLETDSIIQSFLESNTTSLPKSYLDRFEYEQKIDLITSFCIKQNDILLAIDNFVLSNEFNEVEKFDLCCSFALKVVKFGDKHQAISFMNNAHYFLADNNEKNKLQYKKLINLAISLNAVALAVDFEMEFNEKYGLFSDEINKKIAKEYKIIRSVSQKKQVHGHDLLIDYIEKNIKDATGEGKVLVEIGTTRENIPGQGSTMQLAKLCKRKNIKFITVDMDSHNTRWANFIGNRLGLNIEAITKKGEEYLRDDIDAFDFVFLDAYDFDHGGHSELRQSRYEENLGSKIDEEACHIMHLECANSVVKKLKKGGVVCVDDTWLDENKKWSAKGTTAVPYLLNNRYSIIESRNRAVLMEEVVKEK